MNLKVFKFTAGCLVVMLIVATLSACQNKNKNQTQVSIKVGLIGPLTGDAAVYGNSPKKGAELAIQEVNEKQLVKGYRFELVAEDSECDPVKGVSAIQKLTNIDNTKYVIGGMCSSVTLAMAPKAEENKILMVSPVSTNYKVSNAGDYVFRTVPSDAMQGKKGAQVAYKLGFRKAAILYVNNDYGVGLEKIFKDEFTNLGGQVLINQKHAVGDTDFKTQLTKIKLTEADILYLPTLNEGGLIVKQLRELGSNIQVIGTETMQDKQFIEVAGYAAENAFLTSFSEYQGHEAETYQASYKAKYNENKTIYSDYAYDAVYSIVKAMQKCEDKLDTVCVKDELYKVSFVGATGKIEFDKNGDPKDKSFSVFKIRGGEFVEQ